MSLEPCGTLYTGYRQDMRLVRTRLQWLLVALFVAFLIALPLVAGSTWTVFMTATMITLIAVVGLAILTSFGGEFSLGQAAFVMAGGYVTAILDRAGQPFWLSLLASGIIVTAIGMLFGLPSARIKGFYMALATAAASFILIWVITHGGKFTGGPDGLPVKRPNIAGVAFSSERDFYYLVAVLAAIMLLLAYNLVRTKAGRALVAIRDNDIAAEAMGVNVVAYKLLAFGLCSFYAGIAGSLSAYYIRFISPESFSIADTIWYLGMLVVGGMGSITGAVMGVVLFKVVGEILANLGMPLVRMFPQMGMETISNLSNVVYGLIIATVLVVQPRGMDHMWNTFKRSYRLWPFGADR